MPLKDEGIYEIVIWPQIKELDRHFATVMMANSRKANK